GAGALGAPGDDSGCVLSGVVFGAVVPGAFNCTVGAGAAGFGASGLGADFNGMVGAGAAASSSAGFSSPSGVDFNVTRTVSFFNGTADVFFIGSGGLGGCLSSSLMANRGGSSLVVMGGQTASPQI
ncbi:MAG: hypothetical protein GWO24_33195, partial [Akkermansiaceae bacterium]|nr:hypothetical protein [Akkermansiaceae bacterium]